MLARCCPFHPSAFATRQGAVRCHQLRRNSGTVAQSTLFGHERRVYRRLSCPARQVRQTESGTLLLDEISEMPLPLQAKLLRVLQEREVERVGDSAPSKVNIRVLATTNRDMPARSRRQALSGRSLLPAECVSAGDSGAKGASGRYLAAGGRALARYGVQMGRAALHFSRC